MKIKTLLFTLCMAGAMTANAATFYVSPEGAGTKDGSSFDNAFDVEAFTAQAGNNENGDEYYFAAGTYYISSTIVFRVGTGAYLYGNDEGDRTIFSGDTNRDGSPNNGDSGRIIRFQANTADGNSTNAIIVKDIDFTCVFTNTTATSTNESTFTMGAFVVDNSGDVLVENCNFYKNKAGNTTDNCQGGPAAFLYRSTVKFLNCNFYDNETYARGGAVRFTSDNNAKGITTFENCIFKNNTCSGSMGGAIFGANFKSVTFNNCTAYENSANSLGGFFFSNSYQSGNTGYARELNILNSTIANNNVTAANDAQITTRVSEHVNVINSIIPSTDAISAFAFTTASGFDSPDFQFVSGGYNYIGAITGAPSEISWAETDNYGEKCTYETIFGENNLTEDNVLVPAIYFPGATYEEVTAAVEEWNLPKGLDYTKDQLGNPRTGEVTPGALAESIENYEDVYTITVGNSSNGQTGSMLDNDISIQTENEDAYVYIKVPKGSSNVLFALSNVMSNADVVALDDSDETPELEYKDANTTDEENVYAIPLQTGTTGNLNVKYTNVIGKDVINNYTFNVTSSIPTSVETIENLEEAEECFTIFGQRINETYKGIVIKKGKKFILR